MVGLYCGLSRAAREGEVGCVAAGALARHRHEADGDERESQVGFADGDVRDAGC